MIWLVLFVLVVLIITLVVLILAGQEDSPAGESRETQQEADDFGDLISVLSDGNPGDTIKVHPERRKHYQIRLPDIVVGVDKPVKILKLGGVLGAPRRVILEGFDISGVWGRRRNDSDVGVKLILTARVRRYDGGSVTSTCSVTLFRSELGRREDGKEVEIVKSYDGVPMEVTYNPETDQYFDIDFECRGMVSKSLGYIDGEHPGNVVIKKMVLMTQSTDQ